MGQTLGCPGTCCTEDGCKNMWCCCESYPGECGLCCYSCLNDKLKSDRIFRRQDTLAVKDGVTRPDELLQLVGYVSLPPFAGGQCMDSPGSGEQCVYWKVNVDKQMIGWKKTEHKKHVDEPLYTVIVNGQSKTCTKLDDDYNRGTPVPIMDKVDAGLVPRTRSVMVVDKIEWSKTRSWSTIARGSNNVDFYLQDGSHKLLINASKGSEAVHFADDGSLEGGDEGKFKPEDAPAGIRWLTKVYGKKDPADVFSLHQPDKLPEALEGLSEPSHEWPENKKFFTGEMRWKEQAYYVGELIAALGVPKQATPDPYTDTDTMTLRGATEDAIPVDEMDDWSGWDRLAWHDYYGKEDTLIMLTDGKEHTKIHVDKPENSAHNQFEYVSNWKKPEQEWTVPPPPPPFPPPPPPAPRAPGQQTITTTTTTTTTTSSSTTQQAQPRPPPPPQMDQQPPPPPPPGAVPPAH